MHHDEQSERLIAHHMGWLNRAEAAEIEGLIEADPELARRHEELGRTLAGLADWTDLPAVDSLEQEILRRIQRETGGAAAAPRALRMDPVPPRPFVRFPFSLGEVVAAAACVAVLAAILISGFSRASQLTQRARCADNFRHIAAALGAYGGEFDHQLPFAGTLARAAGPPVNWLRERTPGVQRYHNSRNRFVLFGSGYLEDASRFVCPSDRSGIVMQLEHPLRFSDFPERGNCSYDSQLVLGGPPQRAADPGMVVYSDPNPIFRGDPSAAAGAVHSSVHRPLQGQNVLRLGGDVLWATSPNVGISQDNIWQIGQRVNYTGREIPLSPTDSFMIP